MQAINWLALQPQELEIQAIKQALNRVVAARKVRQVLVQAILQAYPWDGRFDLISFYHPSQTYNAGECLALPLPDPQDLRPMAWHVARVARVERVENPIQGIFQALTLDVQGKRIEVAAAIPKAKFISPNLTAYSPEDLDYLSAWFADTYEQPLQDALERLAQSEQLPGKFISETFVPHHLPAISPAELESIFAGLSPARVWLSLEEIWNALPDRESLPQETGFALLRAALAESPYVSLGGDRWTTQTLYEQHDRDVPRGLPVPHVSSKLDIWTEEDEQIFSNRENTPIPDTAPEDEVNGDTLPETVSTAWRAPSASLRLPTLNYLHITQGYFPVGHIMGAFHPEVRLAFVQFISGEHHPFLLNRKEGLLKAFDREWLYTETLNAGTPAGTHLWLEYQGGEKYRATPRPILERIVPCKIAYMEDGKLRIKQEEIPMRFEGDPAVFQADMRFSDIEALFAEAKQSGLSVRDAIIEAVEELCAIDPRHRAHRLDIFNAVYLKRMCSSNFVSHLLYTQPCFEQLGSGYFCFKPHPGLITTAHTPRRSKSRRPPHTLLDEHLLDDLFSEPIAPEPALGMEEKPEPAVTFTAVDATPSAPPVMAETPEPVSAGPELTAPEAEPISQLEVPAIVIDDLISPSPQSEPSPAQPQEGNSDIPAPVLETIAGSPSPTDSEPKPDFSESPISPAIPIAAGSEQKVQLPSRLSLPRRIWQGLHSRLMTLWRSLWRKHE